MLCFYLKKQGCYYYQQGCQIAYVSLNHFLVKTPTQPQENTATTVVWLKMKMTGHTPLTSPIPPPLPPHKLKLRSLLLQKIMRRTTGAKGNNFFASNQMFKKDNRQQVSDNKYQKAYMRCQVPGLKNKTSIRRYIVLEINYHI